jgi:alkylresorcinol/alkylpyrone synthase
MPFIAAATTAFPPHYYTQETLTAALRQFWATRHRNLKRLEGMHHNMGIQGRYLAWPIEKYVEQPGFGARNNAWIDTAVKLGEQAICDLLDETGLPAASVAQLTFVSTTGIASPSVDARLMNRIPFSTGMKRMPLVGLGCTGGAAGLARVTDYLRGHPREAALLLATELCSLTLQYDDLSVANIIASGLFGDGSAAVLLLGDDHPQLGPGQPRVVASQSCFFPDTEQVMGWDVGENGFKVVLSADVPQIAGAQVRPLVESFLSQHNLSLADIGYWITHPGGPKVLDALQESLELPAEALRLSRESLAQIGNVSSVSVLYVLKQTLARRQPERGDYGLLLALGPAFCAEVVLLQW